MKARKLVSLALFFLRFASAFSFYSFGHQSTFLAGFPFDDWTYQLTRRSAEDWDEDKARLEQKVDHGVENVEELPENAARWTGEAVGTVEDIPQDVEQSWDRTEDRVEQGWDNAENRVEQGWDNAENNVEQGWDSTVEAVEDAPENAAEWVGEGVGKVERFGDDVEDYGDSLEQSYDEGRDEARYDDY